MPGHNANYILYGCVHGSKQDRKCKHRLATSVVARRIVCCGENKRFVYTTYFMVAYGSGSVVDIFPKQLPIPILCWRSGFRVLADYIIDIDIDIQ